jgi:hypothetical protein
MDYPFPESPERMVGAYISGGTPFTASEGFLGTSYMHFGFPGMILFAIIIGLLLHLVNSLSIGRVPLRIGVSLVVMPFYSLFTSADLTSALLTYGILPSLLLLWLLGHNTQRQNILKGGLL